MAFDGKPRYRCSFDLPRKSMLGYAGQYDVYTYSMQDNDGWLVLQGPTNPHARTVYLRDRPREIQIMRGPDGIWHIINSYLGIGQPAMQIEEDRQALAMLNGECVTTTYYGDALDRIEA